ERGIEEIVAQYRLRPAAVLLTHGHIDHIWSVAPVCGARNIPAYIHPDDRALLSDPARGFSMLAGQQLFGGLTFTEPDEVAELTDGMTLELAGVEGTVGHAPGHTPGSVVFRLPGAPQARMEAAAEGGTAPRAQAGTEAGAMFSGDLLFAGSIGRTDLPGGDYDTIRTSPSSCPGTGRRRRSAPSDSPIPSWPGSRRLRGRPGDCEPECDSCGRLPFRRMFLIFGERGWGNDDRHARGWHGARRGCGTAGHAGRLGSAPPRPWRRGVHRPARRQRGRSGRAARGGRRT